MIPGFVETGLLTHQELHMDSKDVDLEQPFCRLILHMPLNKEGMFLQLGNVTVDEEKKKDIDGVFLIQDPIFILFWKGCFPSSNLASW